MQTTLYLSLIGDAESFKDGELDAGGGELVVDDDDDDDDDKPEGESWGVGGEGTSEISNIFGHK